MITRVLLDLEPVADGGHFARAVLLLDGVPNDRRGKVRAGTSTAATVADAVAATQVTVAIWPGRDAEFVQMTHTFPSTSAGRLLRISVGDVYRLDRIRIRMDALVGPGTGPDGSADIGRVVVVGHVNGDRGLAIRTVTLPIRICPEAGGIVQASVRTVPLTTGSDGSRRAELESAARDVDPGHCA